MQTESDTAELPFTGERFTPECVREIWYEHWHRYAFAVPLCRGMRVLDAACGEGYGSAMLAAQGAQVQGVDVSELAIGHARQRYGSHPGLHFDCADATRLPYADASFDLVVSFETLEHLQDQEGLMAGFRRVLKPDGLLVVSSPDRRTYSDVSGHDNPYHVRELYRDEFEDLLGRHFPAFRLYGQKLLFQSAIWSLASTPNRDSEAWTLDSNSQSLQARLDYDPLYFIAVAAARPEVLPQMPGLSLFGDPDESVYSHYNHEIRKNMQAGAIIAERDARIAQLEAELARFQCRLDPSTN